jgi:GT2 family glycosyltransferase
MSDHRGAPTIPRGPHAARTLVSILNWNGTQDTAACLGLLDRQADPNLSFLVLDNGSRDDPRAVFEREFPDVEFMRQPANLGFTGGHNLVMALALERGYGSVLLLNNDCRIDIDAIRVLRDFMNADPSLGAASPLIYRDDGSGRAVAVAGWIDWARHRSVRPSSPDGTAPPGAPAMLVGTALLLRCDALRKIGLLDDRYFAYYEDDDISARLAAAGYRAAYCRSATCVHPHRNLHEYSAMALYLMARNRWLFWRSHTPRDARRGLRRELLAQTLHDLALLVKNNAAVEKRDAVIAGFWDGLRGRFCRPPARPSSPRLLRGLAQLAPYSASRFLRDPMDTVKDRLRRRR